MRKNLLVLRNNIHNFENDLKIFIFTLLILINKNKIILPVNKQNNLNNFFKIILKNFRFFSFNTY